jgi:speckle-type POZ protein
MSRSASIVIAKEANGFHLLRIDGYSQTKTVLPGQKLSSQPFNVGGHSWRIDYYPNSRDASAEPNGTISVYLKLVGGTQQLLQARYKFSLLDHDGIAAYELPAETGSFTINPDQANPYYRQQVVRHSGAIGGEEKVGPGCGHEDFIGREDLERREHLIRDDSILIRCDVGVTQIDESWLAHEEHDGLHDEEDSQDDEYEAHGVYGAPRRHRHRRRADDSEYVKRCLVQRPGGSFRTR